VHACQTEDHDHRAGECPNDAVETAFCEQCFTLNNEAAAKQREQGPTPETQKDSAVLEQAFRLVCVELGLGANADDDAVANGSRKSLSPQLVTSVTRARLPGAPSNC
jgi:hypothetical protein